MAKGSGVQVQATVLSPKELFQRFDPKIRMAVGRKLAQDDLAYEELVQDIWLTILQKLPDFDARRGELGAFIYGIARKKLQHFYSRRQVVRRNRTVAIGADLEKQYVEMADGPEARMMSAERRKFVIKALEAMDHKFRRLLEMKYVEENSYREIAAVTGLDEKRVKGRLHYAREIFRRTFEQLCGNEL